jgi:hypothetical protein
MNHRLSKFDELSEFQASSALPTVFSEIRSEIPSSALPPVFSIFRINFSPSKAFFLKA